MAARLQSFEAGTCDNPKRNLVTTIILTLGGKANARNLVPVSFFVASLAPITPCTKSSKKNNIHLLPRVRHPFGSMKKAVMRETKEQRTLTMKARAIYHKQAPPYKETGHLDRQVALSVEPESPRSSYCSYYFNGELGTGPAKLQKRRYARRESMFPCGTLAVVAPCVWRGEEVCLLEWRFHFVGAKGSF